MTPGRQAAIEAAVTVVRNTRHREGGDFVTSEQIALRAIDAYERVLAEQPQDERLAEAAAGLAERRSAG